MQSVFVNPELCIGCHQCEIACAVEHSTSLDPSLAFLETPVPRARVHVEAGNGADHGLPQPVPSLRPGALPAGLSHRCHHPRRPAWNRARRSGPLHRLRHVCRRLPLRRHHLPSPGRGPRSADARRRQVRRVPSPARSGVRSRPVWRRARWTPSSSARSTSLVAHARLRETGAVLAAAGGDVVTPGTGPATGMARPWSRHQLRSPITAAARGGTR